MRPTSFNPSALRQHLRRHKIADLPELKRVLGTDTDLTVFRKLKQLQYLASYTIVAASTPCPKSLVSTIADCGRMKVSGSPATAPCWLP
jgi:hypothetical protein